MSKTLELFISKISSNNNTFVSFFVSPSGIEGVKLYGISILWIFHFNLVIADFFDIFIICFFI